MLDEAATKDKQDKADEEAKKEGKEKAEPVEPVMKSEGKDVWDWRVQNDNKPLWTRSPKDVSPPTYSSAENRILQGSCNWCRLQAQSAAFMCWTQTSLFRDD